MVGGPRVSDVEIAFSNTAWMASLLYLLGRANIKSRMLNVHE